MIGTFRTLGLLGGMGPGATADVFAKIIAATSAQRDQDHIPIMIRSVPQIPDRSAALLGRGASPREALVEGAIALSAAGADFLAIACNTAHHWYGPIRQAAGVPVLHIAEAVLNDLKGFDRNEAIGVLATSGTIRSGFYQHFLTAKGFSPLVPAAKVQMRSVDRAISFAKAGEQPKAGQTIMEAAEALHNRGARVIVLACTELPLIVDADTLPGVTFVDANVSLARACVREAQARQKEPTH